MLVNISGIAISGIEAAQAQIAAVESNVANASNPNYSAESVKLAALGGLDGAGIGVQVLGTVRAEAPFLTDQINQSQSSLNYNTAYTQVAQVAQTALNPTSGSGLSAALDNLFTAFTNLSATPEDSSARSSAISAASDFAQQAQQLSQSLASAASSSVAGLGAAVSQVNQATAQIADLNARITAAQARGTGDAAALLDQRDALVNQLSGLIGATADANGSVSVGGVPLVSGTNALTLAVTGSGPTLGLQVGLTNGNIQVPIGDLGGTIGGMLAGAANINNVRSQANSLATSVASAINAQHQAGYGLDGSTNNALFLIPGNAGGPIAINPAITVQNLAASSTAAGVPGDGSNAAALAAIGSQAGVDVSFPTATAGAALTDIESTFGSAIQSATSEQQTQSAMLQSLQQLKGSVTGVSLNDQLTQLVQYSNMLQAAGRALQAANDLTTFLIQVAGQ